VSDVELTESPSAAGYESPAQLRERPSTEELDEQARRLADIKTTTGTKYRDDERFGIAQEVLLLYYAHPDPTPPPPLPNRTKGPLYSLRREFGCARIWLTDAILEGNVSTVNSIVTRLTKTNSKGDFVAKEAVRAELEEHDMSGRTPLMVAIKEKREDMADVLLSIGMVDANSKDLDNKWSPLHYAVKHNMMNVTQKLYMADAEIDARDKYGMTPLMLCAQLGHRTMFRYLIQQGANIEKRDRQGWTVLMYAAFGGHEEMVRMCLDEGVSKRKKDKKGYLAHDWAHVAGHDRIERFLETYEPQLSAGRSGV